MSLTQRASGILVPTATLDRTERVLPQQEFTAFTRLMRRAKDHGMLVRYHCELCKAPCNVRRSDQIHTEEATAHGPIPANGGRLALVCDCSIWRIR